MEVIEEIMDSSFVSRGLSGQALASLVINITEIIIFFDKVRNSRSKNLRGVSVTLYVMVLHRWGCNLINYKIKEQKATYEIDKKTFDFKTWDDLQWK